MTRKARKELYKQANTLEWAMLANREDIIGWFTDSLGAPTYMEDGCYWIWRGTHPIALVSHIDTIPEIKGKGAPPTLVRSNGFIVSGEKNRGIGADDRAGIAAMIDILRRGYSPTIIITDDEEVGGLGARALALDHPKCPFPISALLQLDRQDVNDAVYYDMDPWADDSLTLRAVIEENNGFTLNWGTFSDISVIAPEWGVAAANLSIGYYEQHTPRERVNVAYWLHNVDRVCKILDETFDLEPLKYTEEQRPTYGGRWTYFSSAAKGWEDKEDWSAVNANVADFGPEEEADAVPDDVRYLRWLEDRKSGQEELPLGFEEERSPDVDRELPWWHYKKGKSIFAETEPWGPISLSDQMKTTRAFLQNIL